MNRYENRSLIRTVRFGVLFMLALHLAAGPAAMAVVADSGSIIGTVEETDAGYTIMTESEDYLVSGFDLSGMVGMMVKATGIVSEGDNGKEIHVTSIEEMP